MPPLAVTSEPTGTLTGVHLPDSHPTISVIIFTAGAGGSLLIAANANAA